MTRPIRPNSSQPPHVIREAFEAQRRQVGSIFVEPFSLGIAWLLEEIQHPYYANPESASKAQGIRDISRAIFIFNDPMAAQEALTRGLAALDAEALRLVKSMPPAEVPAIIAAIAENMATGMSAIGGDKKSARDAK